MKLVDILARELKEWPEQYDRLSQMRHDGGIINGRGFDGVILARLELAEDSIPAGVIVTKAQWQAAVDALKAAENAVPEWNGEGLPPVGTVCESGTCHHMTLSGEMSTTPDTWERVTILAHGICAGVGIAFAQGDNSVHIGRSTDFRPMRTPEQIAADERASAIARMVQACHYSGSECTKIDCAALYDAGYRKQVQP